MTDRTLASIDYAAGDGLTDATDGLKRWFADLQSMHRRGLWCSGRHKIREGELVWTVGSADEPGPQIDTEPGAALVGARVADAPLLEFRNSTPYRIASGGSLGPLWFEDLPDSARSAAHGLALSGMESTRIGFMHGAYLNGDVIHLNKRETPVGDPDPYHTALCRFEGVTSVYCKGWTFNDDNTVGLNDTRIEFLRNLYGGHGAYRGSGAACSVGFLSVGACRGWAIDLYRYSGTVDRFSVEQVEIDGCENGIRAKGLALAELKMIRFVHRRRTDMPTGSDPNLFYPRTAISLGRGVPESAADVAAATNNFLIGCAHRIQAYPGASKSQIGTLFTANGDRNVADVEISQQVDDNNVPQLGIADADTFTGLAAGASVRVWNRARVIHDGYPT